jgi:hypothetical protein
VQLAAVFHACSSANFVSSLLHFMLCMAAACAVDNMKMQSYVGGLGTDDPDGPSVALLNPHSVVGAANGDIYISDQ